MSMHDYKNHPGAAFRDICTTADDISKEAVAKLIREGRHVMSATLLGRYRHRGRHHKLTFIQKIYANWLLTWTSMS